MDIYPYSSLRDYIIYEHLFTIGFILYVVSSLVAVRFRKIISPKDPNYKNLLLKVNAIAIPLYYVGFLTLLLLTDRYFSVTIYALISLIFFIVLVMIGFIFIFNYSKSHGIIGKSLSPYLWLFSYSLLYYVFFILFKNIIHPEWGTFGDIAEIFLILVTPTLGYILNVLFTELLYFLKSLFNK